MNKTEKDTLLFLKNHSFLNQRIVAEQMKLSLGKVNQTLRSLQDQGYLKGEMNLTDMFAVYVMYDQEKGMQRSYSKKAYPWDDGCIESFDSLIKREWLNRFKIFNYAHAYSLVFQ